jgi:hypothetical protein
MVRRRLLRNDCAQKARTQPQKDLARDAPRSRSETISRFFACPSSDKLETRRTKSMRKETTPFVRFANTASQWAGSPAVFTSALALVVAWGDDGASTLGS